MIKATPLPIGYQYAMPDSLEPAEIVALMRTVEIGEHVADDCIESRNDYIDYAELGIVDVGVRCNDGILAGFGSICIGGANGELGDFVVNPEHQGQGIGKALIAERLRIAEAIGLTSLFILPLEPTNPLETYYLERGFHEIQNGALGLGRGPNPVPVY